MTTSQAQIRATKKYKEKSYKRIPLDVKIEEYERLRDYCESINASINGYIRETVAEAIGIDGIAGNARKSRVYDLREILDPDQLQRLEEILKRQGKTIPDLIIPAVKAYVDRYS